MVDAVKRNYPQREIADAAFELQQKIDGHEQIVVGVNGYTEGDDGETPILRIDPEMERKQIGRVQAVRAPRDGAEVERSWRSCAARRRPEENLMPVLVECGACTRPRARWSTRSSRSGARTPKPRSSERESGARPVCTDNQY